MQEEILRDKSNGYEVAASVGLVFGILLFLALRSPDAGGIGYAAEQLTGLAAASLLVAGSVSLLERWRIGRAREGRGSWSGPALPGFVRVCFALGAAAATAVVLFPL